MRWYRDQIKLGLPRERSARWAAAMTVVGLCVYSVWKARNEFALPPAVALMVGVLAALAMILTLAALQFVLMSVAVLWDILRSWPTRAPHRAMAADAAVLDAHAFPRPDVVRVVELLSEKRGARTAVRSTFRGPTGVAIQVLRCYHSVREAVREFGAYRSGGWRLPEIPAVPLREAGNSSESLPHASQSALLRGMPMVVVAVGQYKECLCYLFIEFGTDWVATENLAGVLQALDTKMAAYVAGGA